MTDIDYHNFLASSGMAQTDTRFPVMSGMGSWLCVSTAKIPVKWNTGPEGSDIPPWSTHMLSARKMMTALLRCRHAFCSEVFYLCF